MKKIKIGLISFLVLYLALVVYALLPVETVPVRDLAGPDSRFLSVNGREIHYTQKGQGPPLVLVHGFAGSVFTWRSLTPLLADNYTLYALDLPGFGLSDKSADADYSMPAQAELVLNFMKAAGLSSAALLGHSMGGVIAAYAAVDAPDMIDKLIIVEGGFYHGGAPAFLKYFFFPLNRIMAKSFYTRSGRSRSLLPSYYNKSIVTDEVLEANLAAGRTPGGIDALAVMMSDVGPETFEGLPGKIPSATLLVWSRNNSKNPVSDAERLSREIKNARLVLIEDSGHYIQEEQPEALAKAIKQFLQ